MPLLLLALTVGCAPNEPVPDTGTSAPDPDTGTAETGPCDGAPIETFPGWSAATDAGLYMVSLLSADPTEPVNGTNTWTIAVTDAGGAPVGSGDVMLTPFMSVHGHGTSPPNYPSALTTAGEAVLGPFDLIMPGPWEFTFEITAEAGVDVVLPTFCANG